MLPSRIACLLILFVMSASTRVFAQGVPSPTSQTKDQFAQNLQGAAANMVGGKGELGTQAIHWVLLLDTSQYQGTAPVEDASGQVLETLFGATIRQGDHVSVLPFQSAPGAPTIWNKPVTTFEALRPDLPGTSVADGHKGGRDIEGAVKAALTRLQTEGQSGKAILLVISSSRFSEVPTGEPGFHLTTAQDPVLQSLLKRQNMTTSIALVTISTSQNGGNKVIPLYLQTYVPNPLSGVGILVPPGVIRTSFLARFWWLLIPIIIILAIVTYLRLRPTPKSPLLVLDYTNRRFPKSGLMDFYGPGMVDTEGTDKLPTKLSLVGPDLPPAALGKLFTLDTRGREQAVLTPYLYTAEPKTLIYDKEIALRLKPTEGVDGIPMTQKMTVRRKEEKK